MSESSPRPLVEAAPSGAPGDSSGHHLRVAPDVARRRRRARLAVWSATLVTILSLFTLVAFHVVAVQHAFELDRLERLQRDEARRYEQLRAEVAARSSPAAIVTAAEAIGMERAPAVEWIDAPPAAPRGQPDARTDWTLAETHDEAKPSLDP
jgi:hypothetical protein